MSSPRNCRFNPLDVIASQALFASLTRDELQGLVDRSVCREMARGEVIFREGEPCRGLHVVLDGVVRSYRASPDGHEQVLHLVRAGELLGEVAVFDDGPYLRSARAVEKGRLLFIPTDEVQALYRRHPEVARAVVQELGRRVRTLATLVDQLALNDVSGRVAAAVLRYATQADALTPGTEFRLPCTQESLADEVGTTREGVARALRGFREARYVHQRGRSVAILDRQGLERVAGVQRTSLTTSARRPATTPARSPGIRS